MMPGNASGLGMGKDDYLTERILGINLSLTRERERDGFGKAGNITCSKFFSSSFPKFDTLSSIRGQHMRSCECILQNA